jgi:hypothetical protein
LEVKVKPRKLQYRRRGITAKCRIPEAGMLHSGNWFFIQRAAVEQYAVSQGLLF